MKEYNYPSYYCNYFRQVLTRLFDIHGAVLQCRPTVSWHFFETNFQWNWIELDKHTSSTPELLKWNRLCTKHPFSWWCVPNVGVMTSHSSHTLTVCPILVAGCESTPRVGVRLSPKLFAVAERTWEWLETLCEWETTDSVTNGRLCKWEHVAANSRKKHNYVAANSTTLSQKKSALRCRKEYYLESA